MKKILLLILPVMALFTACKKDKSDPDTSTGVISPVPASFTQKVLLETFTGAGQSQCPDGFVKMDNLVSANATKCIPVYVHFGDDMETSQYTALYNQFSGGTAAQFPSAMVNRTPSLSNCILNRTQWQSNFDVAKAKTAKSGLAITSSISGGNATVEVHCGFNAALTGNYKLSVYLVETNVMGSGTKYDQRNSYNTASGHPYYGTGDPILNFNHTYVLRQVLSSPLGDNIDAASLTAGGEFVKQYTASKGSYKEADLYIVAFVHKAATTHTDGEILNVQRAKLGTVQDWD